MLATDRHGVLLLAWLLLLGLAPAASAAPLEGALTASSALTLDGATEAHADEGALHLRASSIGADELTLTAETLTVTTEWIEGDVVRAPTGQSVALDGRSGTVERTFEDATMTLETFEGHPEVLGIAADAARLAAEGSGSSRIDTVRDTYVTQVGASDNTASTNETPPGFWYRIAGPWLHLGGLDTGQVEGSFDLFVNNVTMQIESEEGSWENWTGRHHGSSGMPVTSYEQRVTTLRVEDGALSIDHPDEVDLLSAETDAQIDGEVTADDVDGALVDTDREYAFRDGALAMAGAGQLSLEATSGSGDAGGSIGPDVPDSVEVAPTGSFDVQDRPGVTVTPIETSDAEAWPWLEIALGAAGLVAAAGFLVRDRLRALADEARARLRERRVEAWMRAGDRLTSVRDYERAADYYARITDRYPEVAEAWYSQALVLSELGRHREAAEAYATANERITGDDPELVDLAATAAWRGGDTQRARELFERLAVLDPMRLRDRLNRPEMADLQEATWVDELFGPDEEGMASYA